MVLLSGKPLLLVGGLDRRRDPLPWVVRLADLLLNLPSNLSLSVGFGEDGGAVLGSAVGTLAVNLKREDRSATRRWRDRRGTDLCGDVHPEVELDQLGVRHARGVKPVQV